MPCGRAHHRGATSGDCDTSPSAVIEDGEANWFELQMATDVKRVIKYT